MYIYIYGYLDPTYYVRIISGLCSIIEIFLFVMLKTHKFDGLITIFAQIALLLVISIIIFVD